MSPAWFLGLFFVSGLCGLIYEVVWLRLAMGAFGATAPFVSLFLSVFMAGLGLGSWSAGRLARRLASRPPAQALRLYALSELILAASALAVPALLGMGRGLLAGAFSSAAWGSAGFYWASGLCTAAALLPWCLCMGATFPLALCAMKKGFAAGSRSAFSYLYLANVLGAACGAGVSACILIELFGFRGTLLCAAALNAAISVIAFILSLRPVRSEGEAVDGPGPESLPPRPGALPLLFTTGLVSMALEVVWIRQFTPYLGNTVYAFAGILTLYLLATFAGTALYRSRLRRGPVPDDLGWLLSGTLSLLPLYAANPYLPVNGLVRLVLGIAPFCLLMGFLTPALVDRWSSGDAERAGTAYAVNVLGCILGPLSAGFLLLPHMGERWATALLALPLFAAGFPAARRLAAGGGRLVGRLDAVACYAILAALGGTLAVSAIAFEDRVAAASGGRVVVKRDYQASVVAGGQGAGRFLLVDGIGMTVLTPITKMMAHLPLALLPRPPRNALVVCFGMGTTFRSLLSWGVPSTAVELVPSVPGLFGFFHEDAPRLAALPFARIVVDDGRRFLARTPEVFDVITIDPAPPMEAAGTSFLYSREFYALVRGRLAPDGIMQQWLMEPMEPAVRSAFVEAVRGSFPYVRAFRSLEGWGYHLLASQRPIAKDSAAVLAARMPPAAVRDMLEWGPRRTAASQLEAALNGEVDPDSLAVPRSRGLSDDRPVNEYFFLRRRLSRR